MSELSGNTEIRMGTERSFGIVFAIFFVIVALFPLIGNGGVRVWSLWIAGAFVSLAYLAPNVLRPLNRVWFRFGLLLSKIVTPITMGVIFLTTVTPIGLIIRIRNDDLIKQRIDRQVDTYWIDVDPVQRAQSSMKKQF